MISYYFENTPFKFNRRRSNNKWLSSVAAAEGKKVGNINIIFCSDPYLLDINIKYLGHEYFTDIITFDYCDGDVISGDLFISVDTVKSNAGFYGASFDDELSRVMVHGLLHLIGYDDHTEEQQAVMRSKENHYLAAREF